MKIDRWGYYVKSHAIDVKHVSTAERAAPTAQVGQTDVLSSSY
jgi:hypothetical protein